LSRIFFPRQINAIHLRIANGMDESTRGETGGFSRQTTIYLPDHDDDEDSILPLHGRKLSTVTHEMGHALFKALSCRRSACWERFVPRVWGENGHHAPWQLLMQGVE
jgi:hypothetical protein